MTATNDQILAEANRRGTERGWPRPPVEHYIIEVVREGWTPPPVDPDLLAVREIAAARYERMALYDWAHAARKGELDAGEDLQYPLAAYKAGREVEAERAKVLVEYVTRLVDGFFLYADYRERATEALAAYKAGKEAAR
jgi:hypothetical protein